MLYFETKPRQPNPTVKLHPTPPHPPPLKKKISTILFNSPTES